MVSNAQKAWPEWVASRMPTLQSLTVFLGGTADGSVILVQHNANFVHQPYLFVVVAVERIVAGGRSVRATDYCGVDFRKQLLNIFGGYCWLSNGDRLCNRYRLCYRLSGTHFV